MIAPASRPHCRECGQPGHRSMVTHRWECFNAACSVTEITPTVAAPTESGECERPAQPHRFSSGAT